VDHAGVPNSQLVKEQAPTAQKYQDKSVAEQNSIDVAWNLLLQPTFVDFRQALCSTVADMRRFRQLIINIVMATDLMDPDLKRLRNMRWAKAFATTIVTNRIRESGPTPLSSNSTDEDVNRKATIVLETLIQASDVSHTMQHWHIYRKWNERLFNEMMTAYRQGRAETNPADSWYQGELNFFDFYIIPLAKKLEDCRSFGVSSDEYLCYALKNRAEWELYGLEIVSEMIEAHEAAPAAPYGPASTCDTSDLAAHGVDSQKVTGSSNQTNRTQTTVAARENEISLSEFAPDELFQQMLDAEA
jgi:3'5'-cyclic nucleotide phosphodiesterase